MEGADYTKWVDGEEKRHETLMKDAGFLAAK
jgi:putative tricarboxylic transport membrane protein